MSTARSSSPRYALIGDLVASRDAESRVRAQRHLVEALARVNALVPHEQALEPTIGDEFQSVHRELGQALSAAMLVRCALPADMDARCGIGVGAVEIVGASAYGLTQDGPAWWSARAAVDQVKDRQRRLPGLRTWVIDSDDAQRGVDSVNGYLLCRDHVVSGLDARQRRIVLGLVEGRTHADIARDEGVSPSAVSQRVRRGGIASLVEAMDLVAAGTAG